MHDIERNQKRLLFGHSFWNCDMTFYVEVIFVTLWNWNQEVARCEDKDKYFRPWIMKYWVTYSLGQGPSTSHQRCLRWDERYIHLCCSWMARMSRHGTNGLGLELVHSRLERNVNSADSGNEWNLARRMILTSIIHVFTRWALSNVQQTMILQNCRRDKTWENCHQDVMPYISRDEAYPVPGGPRSFTYTYLLKPLFTNKRGGLFQVRRIRGSVASQHLWFVYTVWKPRQ